MSEQIVLEIFTNLNARRFQAEPNSLGVFTNVNARCYSVRTEVVGNSYQCGREAFFGQNRNFWQYLPV